MKTNTTYTTTNSDLNIHVCDIDYETPTSYKCVIGLENKNNGIFYGYDNYLVDKKNITHWLEKIKTNKA